MANIPRMDRRQFGGYLAASSGLAATVLTIPIDSAADDTPPPAPKDQAPPPAKTERPAPPSEELLLLQLLAQRFPSEHLDEAALQGIYRDIRGDVARGRILSEFPLKNSDEPCFVFRVYRGED